jgi:hypothetical protein
MILIHHRWSRLWRCCLISFRVIRLGWGLSTLLLGLIILGCEGWLSHQWFRAMLVEAVLILIVIVKLPIDWMLGSQTYIMETLMPPFHPTLVTYFTASEFGRFPWCDPPFGVLGTLWLFFALGPFMLVFGTWLIFTICRGGGTCSLAIWCCVLLLLFYPVYIIVLFLYYTL